MKAIKPISKIRRKWVIAGLTTLSIFLAGQSLAHSGGLDSRGCHAGTQPYHCHRDRSSFNWKLLVGLLVLGSIIQSSEDPSQGSKSTKSISINSDDIAEVLQRYTGSFADENAAIDKLKRAGFTQKQFNRIHDPDVQVWINLVLSQ